MRRALASRPDLVAGGPDTLVVAAGKAAAGMLRGIWPGRGAEEPERVQPAGRAGPVPIVLIPHGTAAGEFPRPVMLLRGGHPFPTAEGMAATARILEEVDRLGRNGRLLFLLSGGASALLEAPAPGLGADDLVAAHRALVTSGLPIASINLVRGCLSSVKAGQLAQRAWPAVVTTLAISDVEGDEPAAIGSGPTVAPARSRAQRCREALELVRQAAVVLPPQVRDVLEAGACGTGDAKDAPADGKASAADYTVVASVTDAIAAACRQLQSRGVHVMTEQADARLRGDTTAAAARVASAIAAMPATPGQARALVLGGETTVAVPAGASGRGGRNLDLAARLALAIEGRSDVAMVVAGTDGCDGSSRAAGAVVDGGSAARAQRAGLPLAAALAAFDTEPAFEAAGDLLVPGPTGTNVGDILVVVAR